MLRISVFSATTPKPTFYTTFSLLRDKVFWHMKKRIL